MFHAGFGITEYHIRCETHTYLVCMAHPIGVQI